MEIFEWGKTVKVSTGSSSGERVGKKTIDVMSNQYGEIQRQIGRAHV